MKRVLWGLVMGACCCACAPKGTTYLIDGTWKGGDGNVVYLKEGMEKESAILDSAVVVDGKFRMQQPLQDVFSRVLEINKGKHNIVLDSEPIIVDCQNVKGELRGKEINRVEVKIKGSIEQELFKTMLDAHQMELFVMLGMATSKKQLAVEDTLFQLYLKAKENTTRTIDSLVSHYPDNYTSALIMRDFVVKQRDLPEVEQMYAGLTPKVQQSAMGRQVKEVIDARKTVAVGSTAPNFSLQTPEGKTIALKDLRGKYVLVDFWASWCGPCMAEVPNVKKVYEKFHAKGFEVIGISLDEKKEAWTNAIAKHSLNWLHVSSLKGWKCPVAALYSVTGIPATFLLDPDGKIIARNLRGEELMEEVAKVL